MDKKRIIQVDEKVPLPMLLPLSIQHVFAMFGASVLVPILFQIDPGIVLFMNGFGTLLFIFLTKGKAPAYLGSSFAFLAPAGGVIAAQGFEYAQGGFVVVDLPDMSVSYIDNGASQTMSMGAGIETAERVANAGVQVVLSGYVGPKAFDALKAAGIKVCQDVSGTVREAVERFQKGEFPFADAPNK